MRITQRLRRYPARVSRLIPTLSFLALLLLLSAPAVGAADVDDTFPAMQPDEQTFRKWMHAYQAAPTTEAALELHSAAEPGGSLDLLSHLDYIPSERSQGQCSNCWAWAGTGCMEIALDVQEGVFERLSIQYINSCQYPITGNPCCSGGWLAYDFVGFYDETRICIPWSNTNAGWQDGDAGCDVPCGTIALEPYYDIVSIQALTIPTYGDALTDEAAIANIKSVLDSGRGVWFAFFVPTAGAWSQFTSFWLSQGESAVCDLDAICSGTTRWGGHAVLCVGYDDSDPDNAYWLMLNSWGTAGGVRPNGLFRVEMDMNYDTAAGVQALYWQTLDVSFSPPPPPIVSTGPATDVEETSAHLSGAVEDDSGNACEGRFAYGPSSGTAYAYATEWQPGLFTGSSFNVDLSGLPPGAPCYFRAQARNAGGTASGDEGSFLTKPLPPGSFSAIATGQTSAALSWTQGAGAERTVIRGKKDSPPSGPEDGYAVYDGTGTACIDEGLDPGSTYWYCAWSVADEAGMEPMWSDEHAQDGTTTIGNGVWMEGDVNLDARVNITDAMLIAQLTVGLLELDATQLVCADTTDDGQCNIVDAMHIAQFTVDPDRAGGILYKLLWSSPEDDALLDPLAT